MALIIQRILLIIFLSAACSKQSAEEKDFEPPVIIINTPVNNQLYTPGQTISITGSVNDNKYIHEIHVHVNNINTGEEYLHVHIHPDNNSASFNQSFTAQAGINYKIIIIAQDPSVNVASKQVEVSSN